jgi:hypothetical protein
VTWFLRREARLAPEAFLAVYEQRLRSRRISIGCSFAPEQFGAAPGQAAANDAALEALKVAVEQVQIGDVRLGLRWNHLCPDGEAFSDFYAPYLEYCLGSPHVRDVCLDIGPIKTFRWPEVHVPEAVLAGCSQTPAPGAVIDAGTELAERSFMHAQRTLDYLDAEFCGSRSRLAFCFNEPFHPFGPQRWTMSEGYLEQLVLLVRRSTFADASFVVSSSEGTDLTRIADLFERLLGTDPSLRGRLVSGYNYYPFTPPPLDLPVVGEQLAALRRWWYAPRRGAAANRARARSTGYRIEVSEAQCEPWGTEQRAGNSLALYQHVLAECIDHILEPQQAESVIRMWGIEHQLRRAAAASGAENRAILELTRAINSLGGS